MSEANIKKERFLDKLGMTEQTKRVVIPNECEEAEAENRRQMSEFRRLMIGKSVICALCSVI